MLLILNPDPGGSEISGVVEVYWLWGWLCLFMGGWRTGLAVCMRGTDSWGALTVWVAGRAEKLPAHGGGHELKHLEETAAA